MRWARTLMLADMLTKSIRANVAHEAAAGLPAPRKEQAMNDAAPPATDQVSPAPVQPPAPDAPPPEAAAAQTQTEAAAVQDVAHRPLQKPVPAGGDIGEIVAAVNSILTNAAALAKALAGNPEVLAFMTALMKAVHPEDKQGTPGGPQQGA